MRRKRGIQVAAVIMGVLLLAAGTVPVQAKTVSPNWSRKSRSWKKRSRMPRTDRIPNSRSWTV